MKHSSDLNHSTAPGKPFFYCRDTDGVDETFSIVCRETGETVAAFHFWDNEREANRRASWLTEELNTHFNHGGYGVLLAEYDGPTRVVHHAGV